MSEMTVQGKGHEGWWDTYGSRATLPQFKLGSTGRYKIIIIEEAKRITTTQKHI